MAKNLGDAEIPIIRFKDWIKDLVSTKAHSGICQCERAFGDLIGPPDRPRLLNPDVHCPDCGSLWIMGLKKKTTLVPIEDGTSCYYISSGGRVCRKCQYQFHEYEVFTSCHADPPKQAVREKKNLQIADEKLKGVGFSGIDDFRRRLEEYREQQAKKKGNNENESTK